MRFGSSVVPLHLVPLPASRTPFCQSRLFHFHLSPVRAHVLRISPFPGRMGALLGARTLLGAPGIATRSKVATRGSWHRY